MAAPRSEAEWQHLADEVMTGVKEWRRQHPTATFREIEMAVDERLARLRGRMLQDPALASAATDPVRGGDRPNCPECGTRMQGEGSHPRRLRTTYEQEVTLTRGYVAQGAPGPACGTGLFPPG